MGADMKISRTWVVVSIVGMICVAWSAAQPVQPGSTAVRFPGSANAIMTLDIAKMLQSPLARQLDCQSKLIKGQADRPFAVPGAAKRVTIGAALHPVGME